MHSRTKLTLEELENADWFTNVGKSYESPNIILVKTWKDAIQWCQSQYWEDLTLEAYNQYCERLFERSKERFNLWNDVVAEMKTYVSPLVERKTEQIINKNDLPKVFFHCVFGDIIGVCMEAEYADIYPPGFFASQAFWYVKGHFPCGWEGEFPDGKLVVF